MVKTAWLRLEWRFMPVAAVARIREPCGAPNMSIAHRAMLKAGTHKQGGLQRPAADTYLLKNGSHVGLAADFLLLCPGKADAAAGHLPDVHSRLSRCIRN
jgi:hypothetical protein